MDAKTFWKEFSALFEDCSKTRQEALNCWYLRKSYTDFIIKEIKNILKEKGGFETLQEYYRIDIIGWTQKKDGQYFLFENDKTRKFGNYLWGLDVAVEHENDPDSWMDEIVKLLYIYCPLRVVIGYLPSNEINKIQEYLDAINTKIQTLEEQYKVVKNLSNGEFMAIIGKSDYTDGDKCPYTPYIYKNGCFVRFE